GGPFPRPAVGRGGVRRGPPLRHHRPPRPQAEGAQHEPARGHPGHRPAPAWRAAQAFRRPGWPARGRHRGNRARGRRQRRACRTDLRHTARPRRPRAGCHATPEGPMKLTLPTWLTLLRMLLIPIMVATFYMPWQWSNFATAAVFGLAALTDWLDGWIARRWQMSSAF